MSVGAGSCRSTVNVRSVSESGLDAAPYPPKRPSNFDGGAAQRLALRTCGDARSRRRADANLGGKFDHVARRVPEMRTNGLPFRRLSRCTSELIFR